MFSSKNLFERIQHLSLGTKLLFLPGIFLLSLGVFALQSQRAYNESAVLGPRYNMIIVNKDLLADVLPPPAFLLESYLLAFRMSSAHSAAEYQTIKQHYQSMRKDYLERIDYWQSHLPEGKLRDLLVKDSREPALQIFQTIDSELLPALDAKDHGRAMQALDKLHDPFEKHRQSIDEIVKLANAQAAEVEKHVSDLGKQSERNLQLIALFSVLSVLALSMWIRSMVLKQSRAEALALEEAAELQRVNAEKEMAKAAAESKAKEVQAEAERARVERERAQATKEARALEEAAEQSRVAAERDRAQAAALRDQTKLILNTVNTAAKGDLTVQVPALSDETLRSIGTGIQTLVNNLQSSIAMVAENATSLNSASKEMSRISSQMGSSAQTASSHTLIANRGSSEVAKNLESITAGTGELSMAIQEIARSAANAARIGSSAMKVAANSNTMVGKLGDSSAQIGAVIKVITAIAQQTNLLALNATIEAARAGESGKGFAVVANEVKELAKGTAQATNDIGRMIDTIQTDTRAAIEAIGEITRIVQEMNDLQNTIASAVEEQTATTNEMAKMVERGSNGTQEIIKSMATLTSSVEETKQGAGKTEEHAKLLANLGTQLHSLLQKFNIGQQLGNGAASARRSQTQYGSQESSQFTDRI